MSCSIADALNLSTHKTSDLRTFSPPELVSSRSVNALFSPLEHSTAYTSATMTRSAASRVLFILFIAGLIAALCSGVLAHPARKLKLTPAALAAETEYNEIKRGIHGNASMTDQEKQLALREAKRCYGARLEEIMTNRS
ncbi:hypothetical protein EV361DRAFT_948407 [Lentinula raphanica]|nr:hypothetical protein EV361DRAFT_948407 [Lentinula raphanica]